MIWDHYTGLLQSHDPIAHMITVLAFECQTMVENN